jgi:Uma2 family endonuclease
MGGKGFANRGRPWDAACMTELLEVPAIRKQAARLTVEDFHRLGEGVRAELLHGLLIQKMPKSPLHCLITARLTKALEKQIQPGFQLRKEDPLTFVDSEPEPDVAVVYGSSEIYASAHPTTAALVIEVSVSTREIDRVKALIYAEAGVSEYWIVMPEEKQVEVYRRPAAQGYGERIVFSAPARIDCESLPGIGIELGTLFAPPEPRPLAS